MLRGIPCADSGKGPSLGGYSNGIGMQMLVNTGSMTQQLENLVQSAIVVVHEPFLIL